MVNIRVTLYYDMMYLIFSLPMEQIPQLGLGTWLMPRDCCKQMVLEALNMGYKHIDCALVYGNEKEIGEALGEFFKTHDRSQYWITSKLWNHNHHPDNV